MEADEVTYCLHIIIRFEIERQLLPGEITVAELPSTWNQKYQDYLGVAIQDDAEGVMQDIHWASGAFGYFPTYALGNIYSGQLLQKLNKDMPSWKAQLAKGDFLSIKQWLTKTVHRHGNLYDPADLIRTITGMHIDAAPYLQYLNDKCAEIYGY